MMPQREKFKIEMMDIQIGVTIVICLIACHFANLAGIPIEAMGVTTGALMCVQDSTKAAYATSWARVMGVFLGGLFGVVIVVIDNAAGIPVVFYLLCGLGVIVNLLVCKMIGMIYVQARVSCLTQLLVVLCMEGVDRLEYALSRFVGTLTGALMAVLLTMIFAAVHKKVNKGKQ